MTASDLRKAQLIGAIDSNALGFEAGAQPTATPFMHSASRLTIELKGGVSWARLTALAEAGVEFLEISYVPGATSDASLSHHTGREFGLILEGELIVELGFERYTLKEGDRIIFDSAAPHGLTNSHSVPMPRSGLSSIPRREIGAL